MRKYDDPRLELFDYISCQTIDTSLYLDLMDCGITIISNGGHNEVGVRIKLPYKWPTDDQRTKCFADDARDGGFQRTGLERYYG